MLPHGTLRGIAAMLLACAFFACMDALLKQLAGHYPPLQVMALRGLTALPLVCVWIAWRREAGTLVHRRLRWGLHLLRAALNMTMLVLFVYGLQTLGLAEAYTLSFIAPLLMVLIAVPLLGESVLPRHWLAIGLGFAGVVIALRPEQDDFLSAGALAVLGAAACYALSNMLGRLVSRTESSSALVFWTTAAMAVGGSLLAAPQWVPIRPGHGWLLAGLAVFGFLGQVTIAEAFRHGQAAAIAPFEYSALAWGIALDWLFWHAVPDGWTLAGAAIIVASGIWLVRGESRPRPQPRDEASTQHSR
ncbi:MAG: DMT family transporter [Rhodocyclaceae bacterium]|nr:DMT family transporter [Pseudomonadota bacterium]MDQ7972065.1 DMT family transporter [Rhodocyclaceae bacterium]MDQ8001815.1 DMT family transporter [Pseudomonadota bacterium]MDQ8017630.1 DMT family transporter [Pseudomonadota bacterium]